MNRKQYFLSSALAVVLTLGLIGCKRTVEDVSKWKANGKVNELVSSLEDPSFEIRYAATMALGDLKAESAVEPLVKQLSAPEIKLVHATIETLASIGNEAAEEHLITTLKLDNVKGSALAATQLGELNVARAREPLTEALNSKNEQIAVAAAIALGRIGDEKSSQPLTSMLQSRSRELRLACTRSLGQIGGHTAMEGLVLALGDMSDGIRKEAIAALVAKGNLSTPYVLNVLHDEDKSTRKSAIAVLKGTDAIPASGSHLVWYRLALASSDNKSGIDASTVKELADMGDDAITPLIEAVAHPVRDIREHAFRALESIGKPCAAPAIAAANTHAIPAAKQWFIGRSSWSGAPSWRIDLWGAATALNPNFTLMEGKATSLQSGGSNANLVMASKSFKVSREYIPLLIGQFRSGEEYGEVNFFGTTSRKKQRLVKPRDEKENQKLAMKKLISAGDTALFPLIAACSDSDPRISTSCAKILGEIGDKRAAQPLLEILSKQVESGEPPENLPLSKALLKLGYSSP